MKNYNEQVEKIKQAYYENTLDPKKSVATFVGVLLDYHYEWVLVWAGDTKQEREFSRKFIEDTGFTVEEILLLDKTFESAYRGTEHSLHEAINKAIRLLADIYKAKGEPVELVTLERRIDPGPQPFEPPFMRRGGEIRNFKP